MIFELIFIEILKKLRIYYKTKSFRKFIKVWDFFNVFIVDFSTLGDTLWQIREFTSWFCPWFWYNIITYPNSMWIINCFNFRFWINLRDFYFWFLVHMNFLFSHTIFLSFACSGSFYLVLINFFHHNWIPFSLFFQLNFNIKVFR